MAKQRRRRIENHQFTYCTHNTEDGVENFSLITSHRLLQSKHARVYRDNPTAMMDRIRKWIRIKEAESSTALSLGWTRCSSLLAQRRFKTEKSKTDCLFWSRTISGTWVHGTLGLPQWTPRTWISLSQVWSHGWMDGWMDGLSIAGGIESARPGCPWNVCCCRLAQNMVGGWMGADDDDGVPVNGDFNLYRINNRDTPRLFIFKFCSIE